MQNVELGMVAPVVPAFLKIPHACSYDQTSVSMHTSMSEAWDESLTAGPGQMPHAKPSGGQQLACISSLLISRLVSMLSAGPPSCFFSSVSAGQSPLKPGIDIQFEGSLSAG